MVTLDPDVASTASPRDGLLTIREAAELVGVKPRTIQSWVNRGLLRRAGIEGKHGAAVFLTSHVYAAERTARRANPARAVRFGNPPRPRLDTSVPMR